MIGKDYISISASDFIRGMSSSAEIADGGFSPDTDGVNLINTPGILYAPALPASVSGLTGQVIASAEDPTGTFNRIMVTADADDDGRIFSLSGANVIAAIGSEDTTLNYIQGRTDMIAYKDEIYITASDDIIRISDIAGTPTVDVSFMSGTFGDNLAPHPAIVFEDNAYYGDGNQLWQQTAAGTPPTVILTLPVGSVIVTLGIDPGSGRMLLSYVGQLNASGTRSTQARVGFYDGQSNKLDRAVIVEEMITAFPTSEGTLYAAYGQNLGYWNGSGVKFLRRFPNIGFDNTELLYKHHFASIGNTLYFLDNLKIIAHGEIVRGAGKVFYPAFTNVVNSNNLTHIFHIGSGVIGMSFATSLFYTWDTISIASTNTMTFYTNFFRFPRPIEIRSVFFEFATAVTSGVTPGAITLLNRAYHGSTGSYNSFTSIASSTGGATRETVVPVVPSICDQATTGA